MNNYQSRLETVKKYTLDIKHARYTSASIRPVLKHCLEELQELVDKETPKEPILYTDVIHGKEENVYQCPNCSSFLGYEEECKEEEYQSTYCCGCGQKIDWSDYGKYLDQEKEK